MTAMRTMSWLEKRKAWRWRKRALVVENKKKNVKLRRMTQHIRDHDLRNLDRLALKTDPPAFWRERDWKTLHCFFVVELAFLKHVVPSPR